MEKSQMYFAKWKKPDSKISMLLILFTLHPGKGEIMGKITDWSLPKDWGLGEGLTEIRRVFWGSDGTF